MNKRIIKKLTISIFLMIICVMLTMFSKNKGVFLSGRNNLPIYSVQTKEKNVAITFDVNWAEDKDKSMMKILDILDKHKVKATFFLIGDWIDDYPEQVKEIYKRGHELGNHSNSHPDMAKVSDERIKKEINITDGKITNLVGKGSRLFRCPSGSYNDNTINIAEKMGYYCIQWDVDSIDWKAQGADKEYNRVISRVRPGSIMLFHTDAKYTPETLPKIIETLESKGYSFKKISDLIYKDNFYIDSRGVQIKK